MYHQEVGLTEAASLGDLKHPQTPDEPVAPDLVKYMNKPRLPRRDQHRVGRAELLEISFADFERRDAPPTPAHTRRGRLQRRDRYRRDHHEPLAARLFLHLQLDLDHPVEWSDTECPERPCAVGRQPFGLVSIASNDAAASPHTDAAIKEAHRAVQEVLERRTYPFVPRRTG